MAEEGVSPTGAPGAQPEGTQGLRLVHKGRLPAVQTEPRLPRPPDNRPPWGPALPALPPTLTPSGLGCLFQVGQLCVVYLGLQHCGTTE